MRIQQTCSLQNEFPINFPALIAGCTFYYVCPQSQDFPPLSLVTHFPALVKGYYVSPHMSMATHFPATCHRSYTFLPLSLITHFPAACDWYTCIFPPLSPLHIFPLLSLVTTFFLVTRLSVIIAKYTLHTREHEKRDENSLKKLKRLQLILRVI